MAITNYNRNVRKWKEAALNSDIEALNQLQRLEQAVHESEVNIAVALGINSVMYNLSRDYANYTAAKLGASPNRFKIVNRRGRLIDMGKNRFAPVSTQRKNYRLRAKAFSNFEPYTKTGRYKVHGQAYLAEATPTSYTIHIDTCPIVNMNAISQQGTPAPMSIQYRYHDSRPMAVIDNTVLVVGAFPLSEKSQSKTDDKAEQLAKGKGHSVKIKRDGSRTLWFIKVTDYSGRQIGKPALNIPARLSDNLPRSKATYAMPFADITPIIERSWSVMLRGKSFKYFQRMQEVFGQHFRINIEKALK